MRNLLAILATIVAVGGCSQPAAQTANDAEQVPAAAANTSAAADMRGTWVGTSQSIVTGKPRHHASAEGGKPLLDNVEFTYVIDGQDGQRFWGTVSSKMSSEPITGVVALDGKKVVARTSEGEIEGTLVDGDTIQLVYSAGAPNPVLAVNTMKRQR